MFAWVLRLLVVGGVACIAVGWSQASDTVQVNDQVGWAPLGVAGVAAVSLAFLGSVLVARQAVALRIHRLSPAIATVADHPIAARVPAALPTTGAASETLVAAASMARYHRPSCPLTAGKPVRPESRSAHEQAGRRACGVCSP